jgi:hypothetical protein
MTLHGFDGARFNQAGVIAEVKAAGGIWLNLYVSGHPGGMNPAPDGFAKTVAAGGLGSNPNYERTLWELVSDRPTGQAAARIGIADAIRVGYPTDGTVALRFSVDVDLDPTRYHAAGAAFDGINDINAGRFRIGCYGQGGLIDYLNATRRTQAKGWLSGSSSFPGFNPASPNVCIVQGHDSVGNGIGNPLAGSDINTITDPIGLAALWPANSPYGGHDMPLSPEDLLAIRTELQYLAGYLGGHPNTHYGPGAGVGSLLGTGGVAVASGVPAFPTVPTAAQVAAAVKADPPTAPVLITDAQIAALASQLAGTLGPAQSKKLLTDLGAVISTGAAQIK